MALLFLDLILVATIETIPRITITDTITIEIEVDVRVRLIDSSSFLNTSSFAYVSSSEKKLFKAVPYGSLILIRLEVVEVVVLSRNRGVAKVDVGAVTVDFDLIRLSVSFQTSFQVFIFIDLLIV
jgi:hypothetical protein